MQVLVVITDGQQTQRLPRVNLMQLAQNLKNKGVVIITVGIGSAVDTLQLREIAQGVASNVITIDNFALLKNKTDVLIERSCRGEYIMRLSRLLTRREYLDVSELILKQKKYC